MYTVLLNTVRTRTISVLLFNPCAMLCVLCSAYGSIRATRSRSCCLHTCRALFNSSFYHSKLGSMAPYSSISELSVYIRALWQYQNYLHDGTVSTICKYIVRSRRNAVTFAYLLITSTVLDT